MSTRIKPISDSEAAFWSEIRQQFYLEEDTTFLNGGSVGPSAKPTIERVIELLRQYESDPYDNQRQKLMYPLVEDARKKLADFIGTKSENIALVLNTTMGMNIAAQGIPLDPGCEILMSDQEYPSVESMWSYIASQKNILIRRIPLPTPPDSPQDIVNAYAEHITPRTRIVLFSHVYCTTGLVAPVQALSELAHQHGALAIVDGAHAIGMTPMNLDSIGCDFYTSSCHKWLLAPKGVGMAYIAPQFLTGIRPSIMGYNMMRPNARASRFDVTGTRDHTHFAGLGTAIDFQMEIGWENKIRPYCLGMARYLKEKVQEEIEGARLTIPMDPEMSGFLTTFAIDGINLHRIRQIMIEDYKIQIASTRAGAQSVLRISTHFYDNYEDIDRFIEALKEIIATRDDVVLDPAQEANPFYFQGSSARRRG